MLTTGTLSAFTGKDHLCYDFLFLDSGLRQESMIDDLLLMLASFSSLISSMLQEKV